MAKLNEKSVQTGEEDVQDRLTSSVVSCHATNPFAPFMMLDSYLQKMILQDWLCALDIASFDIATLGRHLGKFTDVIQFHAGYKAGCTHDCQRFVNFEFIINYQKWILDRKCVPRAVIISSVIGRRHYKNVIDQIRSMALFPSISFNGLRFPQNQMWFANENVIEVNLGDKSSSNMESLTALRDTCPNLTTLYLQFVDRSRSQELLVFVSNSFPRLISLELTLEGVEANLLTSILMIVPFPSLERLSVNKGDSVSPEIIASLYNMRSRSIDVQWPYIKFLKAPLYMVYQLSFLHKRSLLSFSNLKELVVLENFVSCPAFEEEEYPSISDSFPDLQKVVWDSIIGQSICQILTNTPKVLHIINPDYSLLLHWNLICSSYNLEEVEELVLQFGEEGRTFTFEDLSHLQRQFRGLYKLAITGNTKFQMGTCGFAMLRCLAHLKELELHCHAFVRDLNSNNIDGEGETNELSMNDYMQDFKLLTQLTKLTLVGFKVSVRNVCDILISMPQLKRLAMFSVNNEENGSLQNRILPLILNHQPDIRSLKLQVWPTITVEAVVNFLKLAKKLELFEIIGGDEKYCSLGNEAGRLALRQQDPNHPAFHLIPKFTRHEE